MNKINFLDSVDWSFPVPISYGPNRINELPDICKTNNLARPLLVTDKSSKDLSFMKKILKDLNRSSLKSDIFTDISPNPVDDEIYKGRSFYKEGKHDSIIAIGGGSGMDGGKAICLTVNSGIPLWDFEFLDKVPRDLKGKNPFPKLITIPTTAGTGAETEITAMVTDTKKGMKFCIWHPEARPCLALVDPELTLKLPANLTAWTGIDAMIHAIEGYSVPMFHPLCDGSALESLNLISKSLKLAVNEPDNLVARGGMIVGSYLGGVAFLKGLGLVHAISHMVGAEYNTHHGLTNAIILPTVMEYNLPGLEEKVQRMSEAMQFDDHSVKGFKENLNKMLDELDIPRGLNEIGVPEDSFKRIAKKSMLDQAYGQNPKKATLEEVEQLTLKSIKKAR